MATPGIKSFSFVLNEAHWLLQLSNKIQPGVYNAKLGVMKLSVDMFFKEWQDDMRFSDAAPWQSKFSKKRKGWAVMDMDVVLLQFKKAQIEYQQNSGKMFWKARTGSADTDKAKEIYDIPY
jgi:hypothetical protein